MTAKGEAKGAAATGAGGGSKGQAQIVSTSGNRGSRLMSSVSVRIHTQSHTLSLSHKGKSHKGKTSDS